MKKILLLILSIGVFNFTYAQLEKDDVEEIFSEMDIKSYEHFYITFNTDGLSHHKNSDANTAAYEELSTKTMKFDYKENYLKIVGESYTVIIPYDKIKYIDSIKDSTIHMKIVR